MKPQCLFVMLLTGIVTQGIVAAQNASTAVPPRFTVGIEMPSQVR